MVVPKSRQNEIELAAARVSEAKAKFEAASRALDGARSSFQGIEDAKTSAASAGDIDRLVQLGARQEHEQKILSAHERVFGVAQKELADAELLLDEQRKWEDYEAALVGNDKIVQRIVSEYPKACRVIFDILRALQSHRDVLVRVNRRLPVGCEAIDDPDYLARGPRAYDLTDGVRLPNVVARKVDYWGPQREEAEGRCSDTTKEFDATCYVVMSQGVADRLKREGKAVPTY